MPVSVDRTVGPNRANRHQAVPGTGGGGVVDACVNDGFGVRGAPGVGLPEDELDTVPAWPSPGVRLPGRDSATQESVLAHPGRQLHRQVLQQEGKAGCVVSGVRDDEDAGAPVDHCPAVMSRSSKSRSCWAVTVAASSPVPPAGHYLVEQGSDGARLVQVQPAAC